MYLVLRMDMRLRSDLCRKWWCRWCWGWPCGCAHPSRPASCARRCAWWGWCWRPARPWTSGTSDGSSRGPCTPGCWSCPPGPRGSRSSPLPAGAALKDGMRSDEQVPRAFGCVVTHTLTHTHTHTHTRCIGWKWLRLWKIFWIMLKW